MRKTLAVFCVVATSLLGAASLATAAPTAGHARPALTKGQAEGVTLEWVAYFEQSGEWPLSLGEPHLPYECRGPFENVKGKTQWACLGHFSTGKNWQVNVDPYGTWVYRSHN